MGQIPLRLDDELLKRLRDRSGPRGANAFVVGLIEKALELPDETPVIDVKEVLPPTGTLPIPVVGDHAAMVEAFSEVSQPAEMAGYLCGGQGKLGQCGRPAVRWQGSQARCEQH